MHATVLAAAAPPDASSIAIACLPLVPLLIVVAGHLTSAALARRRVATARRDPSRTI